MSEAVWIWTAKAGGAMAGSVISLAYMLPADRREAAIRFGIGVTSGLVFGSTVGLKLATELGIEESIGAYELVLMGSAAASLCAWWVLGLLMRFFKPREHKQDERHER